jgi:RNA polymerase sigma-70 factor (ECF subfamily)
MTTNDVQNTNETLISTLNEISEADLIAGLLSDRLDAWQEFNARYSRMLYGCIVRIIRRFVRSTGSEDANDVYAILCLSLLQDKRKLQSFEPGRGTKLGSWLAMLAVHATYDYLRALKRRPTGIPIDTVLDLAANSPAPEELCIQHQKNELVAQLMNELTEKDRQFMLLHFGQGLEPQQVAAAMGISVKTVYTKKHKLRGRLEAMLVSYRSAA